MENYITYSKTAGEFFIIAHACPGKTGEFQWYLVDDPNETKEEVLEGQIYESITLSNAKIKELYEGNGFAVTARWMGMFTMKVVYTLQILSLI